MAAEQRANHLTRNRLDGKTGSPFRDTRPPVDCNFAVASWHLPQGGNLYFVEHFKDGSDLNFEAVERSSPRPNYVDDSLGALRSPAFDVDFHLYEAFAHL